MKSIFPYPSSLGTPPVSSDTPTDTYTQAEIDTKDAAVLTTSKDYTDVAAMGGSTPSADIGTI